MVKKMENDDKALDLVENSIRSEMPDILEILLIDRTKSTLIKKRNIIWAHDNYISYGNKFYRSLAEVKPELVTGYMAHIIMPRALKSKFIQKERTKSKAEVFTPTWIVKKQNDEIDENYRDDPLATYVKRTWLEITCGEAPYMSTRYDMETGEAVKLSERVGFVDRKLKRINSEVDNKDDWNYFVLNAYKSSYGFEWSGDSLLLARENLLHTFRDYYLDKWSEEPSHDSLKEIAEIISYNVFQMDGLKYIIPLTEKKEKEHQLSLFDTDGKNDDSNVTNGKRVKVMNWEVNKMEYFDKGVR